MISGQPGSLECKPPRLADEVLDQRASQMLYDESLENHFRDLKVLEML